MADVRLDQPIRIVLALLAPFLSAGAVWWATGSLPWGTIAGVIVLVAIGLLLFLAKLVMVPLAIAAESDQARQTAEDELGARIAALEAAQQQQRDPDSIYQRGRIVAVAVHPTLSQQHSAIHFRALRDAYDLDVDQPFEYREYDLAFVGAESHPRAFVQLGNQKPDRTIVGVTCRIVGVRT